MGRHYVIPGITWQITPLVTLTCESLANVNDPSFFLGPQAEYNIATNLYIGVGAFIGIGNRPLATGTGNQVLRSEFGSYPDILFASFRRYF